MECWLIIIISSSVLSLYIICIYFFFTGEDLFNTLGDLGGSSVRDEVGGDLDSKRCAASPNSPSSSGGFRQFSSKGLCIEDMSAQHYFGGCMELYVQDIVMLFGPRV